MAEHDDKTMSGGGKGAGDEKQPVMHALGQSLGILWKAIREPAVKPVVEEEKKKAPPPAEPERRIIEQEVKEIEQGNLTLRETTIREIEVTPPKEIDGEASGDAEDSGVEES